MECRIKFVDEKLKEAFENIKQSDQRLFKELEKAFNDICQNGYVGRNVKKKLIPKELIQKCQEPFTKATGSVWVLDHYKNTFCYY